MQKSDRDSTTANCSLFKHRKTTLERIDKFISDIYFTDVNLHGKIIQERRPIDFIEHRKFGEDEQLVKKWTSCRSERPNFREALEGNFTAVKIGVTFGPTWSTHWFHVKFALPHAWLGKEIHLRWDASCECMVWSVHGEPLQGLTGSGELKGQKRMDFLLSKKLQENELEHEYYIEAACNSLFGAGDGMMIAPPNPDKIFTLNMAEVVVFNRQAYEIKTSLETLLGMAKHLGEDNPRSFQALHTANRIINIIVQNDTNCYSVAKEIADGFFGEGNGKSQHTVLAVGHCHIDTAWLWPYGETIRKCARSWSSVLRLMDEYPDLTFACSQAQQLDWVKLHYPSLYDKLKVAVTRKQFLPIGGTWVEMDGNIPSGEAFVRQFLYGQRFFKSEFGEICKEFWLPDTFGYSAQLPQIMRMFNISRFVTQKLSWSLVNEFPHHTFIWAGIDNSEVLAHFPPANSYTSEITVEEVVKVVKNLKDKGRVSSSLMLFGHGDGGGGPTEDMIMRQRTLVDTDGCAKVQFASPGEFFDRLETSEMGNLCRWVGELYLELHNGTYTTQAMTKLLNRRAEIALHDVEFLHSVLVATAPSSEISSKLPNFRDELHKAWKSVLLNQFHDVLPGSSIGAVHDEACAIFTDVIEWSSKAKTRLLKLLFGEGGHEDESHGDTSQVVMVNTLPWWRDEVVKTSSNGSADEKHIVLHLPPMGISLLHSAEQLTFHPVIIEQHSNDIVMENGFLRVVLDDKGRFTSMRLSATGQEAISADSFGNQLTLYDDVPLYWDAWDVMDYHLETRMPISEALEAAHVITQTHEKCSAQVKLRIGMSSSIVLTISLLACKPYVEVEAKVDWHENHKILKVEFPVNVLSEVSHHEIQFGHISRPTHRNTSWDWAKFEVCAHKWVDISEHGWGVALLNDCKYGHSIYGNVISLSLLRAPKSPDPQADMGSHKFRYALYPHEKNLQEAGVIQAAYEFNYHPISHVTSFKRLQNSQHVKLANELHGSVFTVSKPSVVIESVKVSEDELSSDGRTLVLRLYESFGGRCSVVLKSCLPVKQVALCNGLEELLDSPIHWPKDGFELQFKPFQVISLLLFL